MVKIKLFDIRKHIFILKLIVLWISERNVKYYYMNKKNLIKLKKNHILSDFTIFNLLISSLHISSQQCLDLGLHNQALFIYKTKISKNRIGWGIAQLINDNHNAQSKCNCSNSKY